MKIQGLAIIAIIIILPMSIILNSYSRNQLKTLDLQVQYDSKLNNATYDGIKAFQLNMSNDSTSHLVNSKMRDINASVNTFYNSLSSHFSMYGYGRDVLKNYVPAVVYTLYDGYYIYSTYDNKLDPNDYFDDQATYKDGESIDGLKPYIYYSCRYQPNSNSDFIITYSLDTYITIQGTVNGKPINESGYLLTGVSSNSGKYYYRGVEIVAENNKSALRQYVYVDGDTSGIGSKKISINSVPVGSIVERQYKKINGVKYYEDTNGEAFAIVNDKKYEQKEVKNIPQNNMGIKYYESAFNFKNNVINNTGKYGDTLKDLKVSAAVDAHGKKYTDMGEQSPYYGQENHKIFEELNNTSGTYIEDENSKFNAHKLQVIKNVIESNLVVAISNYNKVSASEVNFAMPKLQEYEWDQITQNISMITFLQGMNIGGKVYNGHSIVSNDINEDYVSEDSIYILANDDQYHNVKEKNIENKIDDTSIGILNTDFERRTTKVSGKKNADDPDSSKIEFPIYYYPKENLASYGSIIDVNDNESQNIYKYFENVTPGQNKYKLAQIYYTALGRERYGMYRVTNKLEEVKSVLER